MYLQKKVLSNIHGTNPICTMNFAGDFLTKIDNSHKKVGITFVQVYSIPTLRNDWTDIYGLIDNILYKVHCAGSILSFFYSGNAVRCNAVRRGEGYVFISTHTHIYL